MTLDPLVFRPRTGRAGGRFLAQIRTRQAALIEELRAVDAGVEDLLERRHSIVADLRVCRDAVGSIGSHALPRDPLPGEVDAMPARTRLVRGADLREVLRAVIGNGGREYTLPELYRAVLARGFRPQGRPSKAISDALRWEIRAGTVVRTGPGRYAAAGGQRG